MYVSTTNTEIDKRKLTMAQQDVGKANFDKMYKVIAQTAGVSKEFMKQSKEAFKEIYQPLMEGRYGNARGGALMSWGAGIKSTIRYEGNWQTIRKSTTSYRSKQARIFLRTKEINRLA